MFVVDRDCDTRRYSANSVGTLRSGLRNRRVQVRFLSRLPLAFRLIVFTVQRERLLAPQPATSAAADRRRGPARQAQRSIPHAATPSTATSSTRVDP